jgi:hypothetical protein
MNPNCLKGLAEHQPETVESILGPDPTVKKKESNEPAGLKVCSFFFLLFFLVSSSIFFYS